MRYRHSLKHTKKGPALILSSLLLLLVGTDSPSPWGLKSAAANSVQFDSQTSENSIQLTLKEAEALTKNTLRRIRKIDGLDSTSSQSLEEEITQIKNLIEQSKTLIQARIQHDLETFQSPSPSFSDTRLEALTTLNRYFNTLLNFYQILLTQKGAPRDLLEKFTLELPREALRLFPLPSSTETLSITPSAQSKHIKIGPSPEVLLGIEASVAQYSESKNHLIPLTQYLIVRQLFQNLGHIRKLLLSYEDSLPRVPAKILLSFPSLRNRAALLHDSSEPKLEMRFRKKIISEFKRSGRLESYIPVRSELIQELTDLIERKKSKKREFAKRIFDRIQTTIHQSLIGQFENEFLSSEIQFAALDEEAIKRELNEIIANSASNIILQEIILFLKEENIRLPVERRVQILNCVDRHRSKNSFEASLDKGPSLFQNLLLSAKIAEKMTYRSKFLSHLIDEISEDLQQDEDFVRSTPVNLFTLFSSQYPHLTDQSPSEEALNQVGKVLNSTNWDSARDTLNDYLDTLKKKKNPVLKFSHQKMTLKLTEKIRENTSETIDFLEFFAKQMHLNENITSDTPFPTLKELNLSATEVRKYREKIKQERAERYPILTLQAGPRGKCLNSELRALFSDGFESPEKELKAVALIEEALKRSEKETLKSIERVLNSDDFDELAVFAQSAALNGLIAETFPARAKEIQFHLQNFKQHGLIDHFIHQTVGNYLSYGFTALLVTHGTGWFLKGAKPWIQALTYGLDPFIKGYLKSAVPLIFIDTVYQYRDLNQKNKNLDLAQATFQSLPQVHNPFTLNQIQQLQKQYSLEEFFFWGRVSMDVFFMYVPEAQEFLRSTPVKGGL